MYRETKVCLMSIGALSGLLLSAQEVLPNFVFMMAEDVSPHFIGLYNSGVGAQLPVLESMADEGIVFKNAYSNAPVSSAARSTLITGCYAPRLGISYHRKLKKVAMPKDLHMFPYYLRRVGYFTANASKTDYNCLIDEQAWDVVKGRMGEWRHRKDKQQPFLFVRTNAMCHESCLHFKNQRMAKCKTLHDPSAVLLLPSHPDTPLFRYTYATFYDRLRKVDEELGEMKEMLREDGVLDNTFIFYFGDNGGSLPGSKGYTSEVGLKVPLVVYVPKNFRHRLSIPIKSRINGFVSFMDFGPTLLHLAGIEKPKGMDGTPFMGEGISLQKVNSRDEVYGYGDRFDELYAFNRTVRKGRFKYSRNFFPYHPKALYALYRYKQLAFSQWRKMYQDHLLNKEQSKFFKPQGVEELYDLETDPFETHNLAALPQYKKPLKEMRQLLFQHMVSTNDLGILPECVWLEEGYKDPVSYGTAAHKRICKALEIANLQLLDFQKARRMTMKALNAIDPIQRYWALTACANWGKEAMSLANDIYKIMQQEEESYVRSKAIVYLCRVGKIKNGVKEMKATLAMARNEAERLAVLNDMAYLKESYPNWKWKMHDRQIKMKGSTAAWRMRYLNERIK